MKGYDYTLPGAYFVTLVAWRRESLFGTIQNGQVSLSSFGRIIAACWQRLPASFSSIHLDEWVIMPNHFHGIIVIATCDQDDDSAKMTPDFKPSNAADISPQRPIGTQPGSLGAIIQNFKSVSTRKINQMHHTHDAPVWQRNYYEHIIRNEAEWDRIQRYIRFNSLHWEQDDEYAPV